MARLEYPKHLYKRGEDGELDLTTPHVVKSPDEEYEANVHGYESLPAPAEPSMEAFRASAEYIEYPKHVYRGDGDAIESVVVKDAAEEAAAEADGYGPHPSLVAVEAEPEVDGNVTEPKPTKRGRKPKA